MRPTLMAHVGSAAEAAADYIHYSPHSLLARSVERKAMFEG